jgi:hypothetical protein
VRHIKRRKGEKKKRKLDGKKFSYIGGYDFPKG